MDQGTELALRAIVRGRFQTDAEVISFLKQRTRKITELPEPAVIAAAWSSIITAMTKGALFGITILLHKDILIVKMLLKK